MAAENSLANILLWLFLYLIVGCDVIAKNCGKVHENMCLIEVWQITQNSYTFILINIPLNRWNTNNYKQNHDLWWYLDESLKHLWVVFISFLLVFSLCSLEAGMIFLCWGVLHDELMSFASHFQCEHFIPYSNTTLSLPNLLKS